MIISTNYFGLPKKSALGWSKGSNPPMEKAMVGRCGSEFFWTRTRHKLKSRTRIRHKLKFQTQIRQKRNFWIRNRSGPDLNFVSVIFDSFCVHDEIKDRDFSYLLVTLRKKVNIKLCLAVFSHIVLFRFEAKHKPDPKSNLDMDLVPTGSGRTRSSLVKGEPAKTSLLNSVVSFSAETGITISAMNTNLVVQAFY
jgi:hypothetical protein